MDNLERRWIYVCNRQAPNPRGKTPHPAAEGKRDWRLHDPGPDSGRCDTRKWVDVVSTTGAARREACYERREDAYTRRKLEYQALRSGPMTVDGLCRHYWSGCGAQGWVHKRHHGQRQCDTMPGYRMHTKEGMI